MQVMDNKKIAAAFDLLAQLMELHGQNPFRTKAIASAAYKISKLPFSTSDKTEEELSQIPGLGSSTAQKIKQLETTGTLPELEKLKAETPEGILQMLSVKGLGPKKVLIIWKELGLESLGEVYYACNENRLIDAKGFGLKTQEQIKKTIEFTFANQGWMRYASVEAEAEILYKTIQKALGKDRKIEFTGEYRRRNEVLKTLQLLVEASPEEIARLHEHISLPAYVELLPATAANFAQQLFLHSSSTAHLHKLLTPEKELGTEELAEFEAFIPEKASEEEIYQSFGLNYIAPELREGGQEIKWAKAGTLPELIEEKDLQGTLHNHSTYSDGVHTLEEMALYCRNEMGLAYFGIADHSQIAVYANGLSIERVLQQWQEIDRLNQKLAPFKIFKGIESDILSDGSLDYPDEILNGFDYVVASVHSNLKMEVDKATNRLINAIENPYTTILGHPTGRLLLARAGYPIDHAKVIDACAANGVVIEINANPLRLDLDWRWHQYAIEKGVILSINPDAHRTAGLHDMHYGVLVSRKGGVSAKNCLNAFSLSEITSYFASKKK